MPFPLYNRFRGIDTYTDAGQLGPDMLQRATNVYVRGTNLVSRPGKQALLDAAMTGGPVYGLQNYQNSAGENWLVFAQDRKLWKWKTTSTVAPTEIKDSSNGGASFNFPLGGQFVQMVRHGKYLYGTDGTDPLFRTDLTIAGSGSVGNQAAPSVAPVASLTSTTLDATDDATRWTGLPSPSVLTNLLTNGGFEQTGGGAYNGAAGSLVPPGWVQVSGDSLSYDTTHQGDCVPAEGSFALLANDPNDVIEQVVTTLPTLTFSGTTLATQKARVYALRFAVHQADSDGVASLQVTVSARNSSHATIASVSEVITRPHDSSPGTFGYYTIVGNFLDLPADPAEIAVTLQSGGEGGSGFRSTWVDNCQLFAADTRLAAVTSTVSSLAATVRESNTFGEAAPFVSGQWLRRGYTTAKDFTVSNRVSVAVSFPPGIATAAGTYPRFRFGFTKAGDTAITWANVCTYDETNQFISADISTIPRATRLAANAFFLQILDNLPDLDTNGTAFTFGPITAAGNLSVGFGDYSYLFTEIRTPDSGAPGDFIESSGSPYSATVTPTGQQAQTLVDLDAGAGATVPQNAGTTGYRLYRFGGALNSNDDPYPRLIATVPIGTNATGDGWTWTAATKTFSDNVPDSALVLAQVYEKNRDNFPSGITCLCVANGRLFAAKGNTILVSWLLDSDAEAALYTSLLSDPLDASLAIKGGSYPLDSINNRDGILSLVPMPTAILALRENSLNLLNGYDPTNFATVNVMASAGIGCIAPGSAIVDGNAAYYLAASGVLRYDVSNLTQASLVLEGVLNPRGDDGAPVISPDAYAGCVQVYHDRRRYLFAPVAGGSANSVCYLYDTRTDGYTTFSGMNIASACSLSSAADRQDLFLGGVDGMLYTLRGSVDKATRLASGTPITVDVLTREYGTETPSLDNFYENRAQKYYFSVETSEASVPLTFSCFGSAAPSNIWSHAYTGSSAGGTTTGSIRAAPNIRGERLTQRFVAVTTAPLSVSAIGLMTSEGRKLP